MNQATNKRAILYLRFSSEAQAGGVSLEVQESDCRRYCEAEGYEVVEVLKNAAVSASSTNEHRINELKDFVKNNKSRFDVLVVYDLTRFARSQEQHHLLRGDMMRYGILLRSTKEKIDETPSGKLIEGIHSAVAQYDNDLRREKVTSALWQRVKDGLYPWKPPPGYMKDPNRPIDVKLSPHIPDPVVSSKIKKLFLDYKTGAYSQSALGRKYGLLKQKVYKILNSPYYAGYLKNHDGQLIEGKHKGLVSITDFYKCQDIANRFTNNTKKPRLHLNPDFPLRGLLTCHFCGKNLTACHPKKPTFTKYYCFNKECKMYSHSIDYSDLKADFLELLKTVKPTEETKKKIEVRLIPKYEARKQELKTDWTHQMETIAKLQSEQNWLVKQGRRGEIPEALATAQVRELEKEILIEKAKLVDIYPKEVNIHILLEKAFLFLEQVDDVWDSANFEAKIRLQKMIFTKKISYNVEDRAFGLLEPSISPLFSLNSISMWGHRDSNPEPIA